LNKNILAIGVIFLFIVLGVQPALAKIQSNLDNKFQPEKESSGLFWGTYRNCHISGEIEYDKIFPKYRFLYGFNFALIIIGTGLHSCKLYGIKGNISICSVIGFGFTGDIYWDPDPREPDTINGDLLFCIYLKELNQLY
jgi:hypothetical protein